MTTRRIGDIAIATALLAICLPVILIASIAVWLDLGGAPVRRFDRVTPDGRVVGLWRFRVAHDTRYGPRPTLSGAVLRRWHLDQVPQLWNVVAGDLSLLTPPAAAMAAKKSWALRRS
jgi:lipopolysaccharide/colanic/teichoic acid biosynthesis glycosyltransferase